MTAIRHDSPNLLVALIAGLGVESRSLGSKCEAALRAVGGWAVPYLRAAASGTPTKRRKRLEAVLATIDERQDSSPDASSVIREALVLAATVQNARDNPELIPVLRRLSGPAIVELLVLEAVDNRKKPSVCLRILQMVEQLGGPSTVKAVVDGIGLTMCKNAAVRELALKLFGLFQATPRNLKSSLLD